jgi:hypothetical protein
MLVNPHWKKLEYILKLHASGKKCYFNAIIHRGFAMADSDRQLDDIKRLLILLLMKLGSTSEELAMALQVDASAIRRTIPAAR